LARYILAGFDQRYAWTGGFPQAVEILALVVCVIGYALFVWATASNAFFSQIVRIQTERAHRRNRVRIASSAPWLCRCHPV